MNRTAVKNFAQWARKHLHEQTRQRLALFGVTDKGIESPKRIEGGLIIGSQTLTLTPSDIGQYDALIRHYHTLSGTPKDKYLLLVDEIAYSWFNRLAALRFMEVNGYAERALSSDQAGQSDPNLLRDAVTLAAGGDLPGVTPDLLDEWGRLYQPGEIYRRLLVAQAAAFEPTMPFLFSRDKAWLDLFLPDTLLNQDSIVRRMVADIPEEDWQDIEIVGWLYQFYISERKDEVFAQKGKYTPRDIPAATQLFTPHWIVRYMVENSLGRVWLEAHPESGLRQHMPYYLESENPAPEPNPALKPEDLTVIDPACGSGHILVYAFDLLAHIYREQGYGERDIPALILEHNLHGLDIDERAAQLASFAVVMKARELNSRLFRRDMPQLNILQVRNTRHLKLPNAGSRDMFGHYATLSGGLTDNDTFNPNDWQPLADAFADADHLGSLITPPEFDTENLREQVDWLVNQGGLEMEHEADLRHLLKQAETLKKKYDSVIANPPYMGSSSYSSQLEHYIERYDFKGWADLCIVFLERSITLLKITGYCSNIVQQAWMFNDSYLDFRKKFFDSTQLSSLIHMGPRAFPEIAGEVVQVSAMVFNPKPDLGRPIRFIKLDKIDSPELKQAGYFAKENASNFNLRNIFGINNLILMYWASDRSLELLKQRAKLSGLYDIKVGVQTNDNERFLRYWMECSISNSSIGSFNEDTTWFPYNKGGSFRRWYGNRELLINWQDNGRQIKEFSRKKNNGNHWSRFIRNPDKYFLESVTWSSVTTGLPAFRWTPSGSIFDSTGPSLFSKGGASSNLLSVLSFLNSSPSHHLTRLMALSQHINVSHINDLPDIDMNNITSEELSEAAISLSKTDWDNFETSWDFQTHPLLRFGVPTLPEAFSLWEAQALAAFRELQRLEVENNRYWIDAYGLQDELTPEVPDEQIAIRRADLGRDVRSLLSYAVGCMMGRYSLDEPGLIHAGQPFDAARHTAFAADKDGILPVTTESYFEDDVTTRFAEFLRVAFGAAELEGNMAWVAASLGGQRAGEAAEERIRRYFATEFMSDHIQTYKKRPIYWLFTSGKKRGFGALVYLHRFGPDTLARLRTDYLLPLQGMLEARRERAVSERDAAGSTAAKRQAEKVIAGLKDQIAEVHAYDDSLKHAADLQIGLDLDDGVAYNYWLMSAAGQEYLSGHPLKGGQDLVYSGSDLKMADLEKKSQWKRDLLAQEAGAGQGVMN